MSYILNALRKSERERQATEPDTVTSRIAIHHSQPDKGASKLIAALIVINVSILGYFLGFKDDTAPIVQTVAKPELPVTEPAPAPVKTSRVAKTEPQLVENVPASKAPVVKMVPTKPVKPAIAAPQTPEPIKPKIAKPESVPKQQINPAPETVEALKPAIESVKDTRDTIEKTAPIAAKRDLPYLHELPAEVGRAVPSFSINVFSYSSNPAERFVMIDMVKYVPGQRIKDQLELKEIRENSIVVTFEGHTFKIGRP